MLHRMKFFSSDRERRLWLWTGVVLAAIYSSLGYAGTLVMELRERNLLGVSFAAFVAVFVTAFIIQWIRNRPSRREIGVFIGVGLAYWLAFLRIENPAERTHLFEYGILAALIHQALLERRKNGRLIANPATLTVAVTALLGLVDESIQAILPNRVFDWIDVAFNALAGFMVVAARLAMKPSTKSDEKPGWRLWFLWTVVGAIVWGWSMDPSTFSVPRPVIIFESLPLVNFPEYGSVAAGGALIGLLQWLMLRKYIGGSIRWVLASFGGVFLGAQIVGRVREFDPDLGLILGVSLFGFLVGILQWLVIRRQVLHSWLWIPASTIGWLIAIPAGDITGPPGWAIYSVITSTFIVWMIRQDRSPNPVVHQTSLDK